MAFLKWKNETASGYASGFPLERFAELPADFREFDEEVNIERCRWTAGSIAVAGPAASTRGAPFMESSEAVTDRVSLLKEPNSTIQIFAIIPLGDHTEGDAATTAPGWKIYASPFWAMYELDALDRRDRREQRDGQKRFLYQTLVLRQDGWVEGSHRTSASLIELSWKRVSPEDLTVMRVEHKLRVG